MASRLVLHIGVQKSGTTYVQRVMRACAGELGAAGFGYPVFPSGDPESTRNPHETATYGLLGTEYPWVSAERQEAERGTWAWLAGEVRAWPGTALVSAEAISVVREDAARRLLEELDVADVQVVATARGLGSLLPSAWQQHLRNGRSLGFGTFLSRLAAERERGWESVESDPVAHLWRAFALGRLVRRWARIVGPERVTMVVNRGRPPELLWRRFAGAVGLPDGIAPGDAMGAPAHTGLTAAEAAILESINAGLNRGPWTRTRRVDLREHLIHQGFAPRSGRGPRIAVPPEHRTAVEKWSAEDLDELADSQVRIVGDLDELRFDPEGEPGAPTVADLTAAAGAAVLAMAAPPTEPVPPPVRRRVTHRLLRRH